MPAAVMNAAPMIASVPSPAGPASPQAARAWRAAQDFEAMALSELLGPMFETLDSGEGAFGGGVGEQSFRPFFVQVVAKQMAAQGGLGLAMPVFQQMLRLQEGS